MGYDSNDPKQVAKARKQAEFDSVLRLSYFKRILSDADGREFAYRLLLACGVFSTSYVIGDPYLMTFREGKRYIGGQLLADLKMADAASCYLMMDEAEKRGLEPLFPTEGL